MRSSAHQLRPPVGRAWCDPAAPAAISRGERRGSAGRCQSQIRRQQQRQAPRNHSRDRCEEACQQREQRQDQGERGQLQRRCCSSARIVHAAAQAVVRSRQRSVPIVVDDDDDNPSNKENTAAMAAINIAAARKLFLAASDVFAVEADAPLAAFIYNQELTDKSGSAARVGRNKVKVAAAMRSWQDWVWKQLSGEHSIDEALFHALDLTAHEHAHKSVAAQAQLFASRTLHAAAADDGSWRPRVERGLGGRKCAAPTVSSILWVFHDGQRPNPRCGSVWSMHLSKVWYPATPPVAAAASPAAAAPQVKVAAAPALQVQNKRRSQPPPSAASGSSTSGTKRARRSELPLASTAPAAPLDEKHVAAVNKPAKSVQVAPAAPAALAAAAAAAMASTGAASAPLAVAMEDCPSEALTEEQELQLALEKANAALAKRAEDSRKALLREKLAAAQTALAAGSVAPAAAAPAQSSSSSQAPAPQAAPGSVATETQQPFPQQQQPTQQQPPLAVLSTPAQPTDATLQLMQQTLQVVVQGQQQSREEHRAIINIFQQQQQHQQQQQQQQQQVIQHLLGYAAPAQLPGADQLQLQSYMNIEEVQDDVAGAAGYAFAGPPQVLPTMATVTPNRGGPALRGGSGGRARAAQRGGGPLQRLLSPSANAVAQAFAAAQAQQQASFIHLLQQQFQ